VLLMYPSGNRDEAEFERPFEFDITRTPNRHVAFGAGVHFCLGAALARMETQAIFAELLPRLEQVELAGTVEGVASTFVSGLKRLPIRYRLTPGLRAPSPAAPA
jgi:cytochrome P450